MSFLVIGDYSSQVKGNVLDDIVNADLTVRQDAERKAQSEMEGYLAIRYDVPAIFSQSGTSRNQAIVMYMVDISLYHLHSRINPGQVPELRRERYNEAKRWLEWVSAGKLKPNLPVTMRENEGTGNTISYGSQGKRTTRY